MLRGNTLSMEHFTLGNNSIPSLKDGISLAPEAQRRLTRHHRLQHLESIIRSLISAPRVREWLSSLPVHLPPGCNLLFDHSSSLAALLQLLHSFCLFSALLLLLLLGPWELFQRMWMCTKEGNDHRSPSPSPRARHFEPRIPTIKCWTAPPLKEPPCIRNTEAETGMGMCCEDVKEMDYCK